jgi:hypothetical protein
MLYAPSITLEEQIQPYFTLMGTNHAAECKQRLYRLC